MTEHQQKLVQAFAKSLDSSSNESKSTIHSGTEKSEIEDNEEESDEEDQEKNNKTSGFFRKAFGRMRSSANQGGSSETDFKS